MRSHGPELSCKAEQPGLLYRLFAWGIVSISQREYKAQEGTNAEQPSLFCFCGAFTMTAANEAKKWYRRPKVREFADRLFREKLSFLQRVFDLFSDEVKAPSSPGTSTAMEYLCEASVYAASVQKPDGIRMLLEQLRYVPEKGYHYGCEGMVRILLKGKNFDKFKTDLANVDRDTKVLVRKILEGITDKRTAGKRKELDDMLKKDLGE